MNNFFESREWQELRYSTLRKFGFKCMACGAKNTEFHVDHIKPRSRFPELELSPDNLQVLCRDCNLGKGAEFTDDLRPNRSVAGRMVELARLTKEYLMVRQSRIDEGESSSIVKVVPKDGGES